MAWLLGVAANFIRQPLILAYLVAGFLLGPFGPQMGAIRAVDQHHRRARPDLHAVHDRAGDRPEEDRPRRQRHPGHLRGADPRLLCARRSGCFSLIGIPLGDRRFDALYLAAAVALSQHRHHRQGALRQARARHAARPHHARRAGAAGPVRDPVPRDPAEPERPAVRRRAGVGRARRRAAGRGAADQPLHAAASVPPDRAPAGARAGRRAGVVLRGRRVRRVPRPVARDGRADRRRLALDLPLRARRHRQGDVAARFLHHAVLRRARHDDPAADALGARARAHSRRLHAGEPARDRVPAALRDAAGPARQPAAGHQSRPDQRVLAGADPGRRAVRPDHARRRRRGIHRLRRARGAQHLRDDAQRRDHAARDPGPQAARAARSRPQPRPRPSRRARPSASAAS